MEVMPAVWTLLEKREHLMKEAALDREMIDLAEHASGVWAGVISANQQLERLRKVCAAAKAAVYVLGPGAAVASKVVASGVATSGSALRLYQDAQIAALRLRLFGKDNEHRHHFVASPKRGATDLCRVPGPLQLEKQQSLAWLSHNNTSEHLFGGFRLLHHKGAVQWVFENNNVGLLK